jgi:integrase
MSDGGGLYLLVTPAGGKLWRLKYKFDGKEKLLSFGAYPDVPLQSPDKPISGKEIEGAREKRRKARQLLAAGLDPGQVRKDEQQELLTEKISFEAVAREWHEKQKNVWAESHAISVLRRLEHDVFGAIGSRPISTLETKDLLEVLQKIEKRGALDTAFRNRQVCGQIFRYAVATGQTKTDITLALKGALTPYLVKHHSAIIEPEKVAELLRRIDDYQPAYVVKFALQLAPLVFLRVGELRGAEWSEFNLTTAEWNIPPERMKLTKKVKVYRTSIGDKHLVPLSRQALELLTKLKEITGGGKYLFPGRTSSRTISENTINAALRSMGYPKEEMCGHGFRAMAKTMLTQNLNQRSDLIEHQLAHLVKDPNGTAYNRTSFVPERRKMMQQWADYLDSLKSGKSAPSYSFANYSQPSDKPAFDRDSIAKALIDGRFDEVPEEIAAIFQAVISSSERTNKIKTRKKPGPSLDSPNGQDILNTHLKIIEFYNDRLAREGNSIPKTQIKEWVAKEVYRSVKLVEAVLAKNNKGYYSSGMHFVMDIYSDTSIKLIFNAILESTGNIDSSLHGTLDILSNYGDKYTRSQIQTLVNCNYDVSEMAECKSDLDVIMLIGSKIAERRLQPNN